MENIDRNLDYFIHHIQFIIVRCGSFGSLLFILTVIRHFVSTKDSMECQCSREIVCLCNLNSATYRITTRNLMLIVSRFTNANQWALFILNLHSFTLTIFNCLLHIYAMHLISNDIRA